MEQYLRETPAHVACNASVQQELAHTRQLIRNASRFAEEVEVTCIWEGFLGWVRAKLEEV